MDLVALRETLARRTSRTIAAEPGVVRAAVAMVLRMGSLGPEVLMIRRATHPDDPWSGHMALPGGRFEPPDATLVATAKRETREEVALDLDRHGRLLGRLDEVATPPRTVPRSLVITPFVFELIETPPPLTPNYEVAELFWVSLAPIKRGEADDVFEYQHHGDVLKLPAWRVQGQVVWGLTHRMLSTLIGLG